MPSWAIVQKDDRVLLLQRSINTSRPRQWFFPGGKVKPEESAIEACIREVKEEAGIDVTITKLVSEDNGTFFFSCEMINPNQIIILKRNESMNYKWIEPAKLLSIGDIMNLKIIVPILELLDYTVILNEEAKIKLG